MNFQELRNNMELAKSFSFLGLILGFCLPTKAQDLSTFSTKTPIKVSGNLSARTNFYTAQNLAARRVPFGWQLSGGATVTLLNGFQIPFSFIFSEQNRSFSQPFNQFGMSLRYKGYTLHAGYRNLTFSEFTLAGQSIFGGGGEIQKGKFRAGFMAGRFNRATAGYQSATPTFYRQGWSGRVGIGSNENFIDLIILSAADNEKSIGNYTNNQDLRPESNTVVGLNFKKSLLKKISISAEAAVSLYTFDQTSPKFDSLKIPEFVDEFANLNISSEPTLALKSSLEYRGNYWGIGLGFQQIDAGYRSMGAYYLYNDMRMLSAAPNFSLFRGKISINGNFIQQTDNLKKLRAITTTRLSPSVSVGLNISQQFGVDFNGQVFTTSQAIIKDKVGNLDDLQNNSLYSVTTSPRWNISNNIMSHSVNITGGWQAMADKNLKSKEYTEFKSITAGAFYALSLFQSQTSINAGVNYSGFNSLSVIAKPTYSFNAGGSRSFQKGKYSASANTSYTLSEFSNALNASGNFSYKIDNHHQLNATISTLFLNYEGDTRPTAKEQRLNINYNYRF
jgi:hypothetical protein